MTVKDLKKYLEAVPDNAEVRYASYLDNDLPRVDDWCYVDDIYVLVDVKTNTPACYLCE